MCGEPQMSFGVTPRPTYTAYKAASPPKLRPFTPIRTAAAGVFGGPTVFGTPPLQRRPASALLNSTERAFNPRMSARHMHSNPSPFDTRKFDEW